MYLYRAVDSEGNTIDLYLSKTRNHMTAKGFFKKALQPLHVSNSRVIIVDKNQLLQLLLQNWRKKKDACRHPNETTQIFK